MCPTKLGGGKADYCQRCASDNNNPTGLASDGKFTSIFNVFSSLIGIQTQTEKITVTVAKMTRLETILVRYFSS
jgi:hypothetical protein